MASDGMNPRINTPFDVELAFKLWDFQLSSASDTIFWTQFQCAAGSCSQCNTMAIKRAYARTLGFNLCLIFKLHSRQIQFVSPIETTSGGFAKTGAAWLNKTHSLLMGRATHTVSTEDTRWRHRLRCWGIARKRGVPGR